MVAEYLYMLRSFNRNVRLYLFTAALLGFTAFGGIYPVLFNLYLLRMGYGPDFVGTINSAGGLTFALFSLPASMVSRRWGGRRTMTIGLGIAVLAFGALPIAEFCSPGVRSGWLFACFFARALGFALYWVNARPFLMNATNAAERRYVYSAQAALLPLAGFAGSLVAGLMPGLVATVLGVSLDHPAPYRYPLWMVAILLLPALLALRAMDEFQVEQHQEPATERSQAPLKLIAFLSFCILFQVTGQSVAMSFFNVYLDDRLQVPTSTIGAISAVSQLLSALSTLGMPALAKRWGNGRVFFWGTLGAALSLTPLAFIQHWLPASLGYLGAMVLGGIAFPAINVYQMELVSPQWRMAMSGATTMANGLNFSATSFLGGHMIKTWGYSLFFLSGMVLTVVGAVLFWAYFVRKAKPASAEEK